MTNNPANPSLNLSSEIAKATAMATTSGAPFDSNNNSESSSNALSSRGVDFLQCAKTAMEGLFVVNVQSPSRNEKQTCRATTSGCELCPRKCGVEREKGMIGVCGAGEAAQVALADLHMWEEPPITGEHGSGAIFFSHCPLKCVYCQNRQISREGKGNEVTPIDLAQMMLDLQARGATNINLVTGTHYLPQIEQALTLVGRLTFKNYVRLASETGPGLVENNSRSDTASPNNVCKNDARTGHFCSGGELKNHVRLASEGVASKFKNHVRLADEVEIIGKLDIPIVWNTSGFETVETVHRLNRFVDIYLTDFKYFSEELGKELSAVSNYCKVATVAIKAMFDKGGDTSSSFSDEINGAKDKQPEVIIRHLILPGHVEDSKKVIKHVFNNFGDSVTLSIMNQYTPVLKTAADTGDEWSVRVLRKHPELGRSVTDEEYEEVLDFADSLGIEDYFWQEGETCKESFIPNF